MHHLLLAILALIAAIVVVVLVSIRSVSERVMGLLLLPCIHIGVHLASILVLSGIRSWLILSS